VWGVLAVIKCIYLSSIYLHFIQDMENRCILLTTSMSFVDLTFQKHWVTKKHHMDQNPYISSLCPKPEVTNNMTRGMLWHKARVQPSQSGADKPRFGVFLKSAFTTCQAKSARRESKVEKVVQLQNLAARPPKSTGQPDKWASRAPTSAKAPT
jgi:hypothetical protein